MELLNATGMEAAYTMGTEPSGSESLVVVVEGTFRISANSEVATLADEQQPLVMADTFIGEPGFSAPVYEADFPPIKPRCDVLFNGSAYALGGRPAKKVPVSLRIDELHKAFNEVWGHASGRPVWPASVQAPLNPSKLYRSIVMELFAVRTTFTKIRKSTRPI